MPHIFKKGDDGLLTELPRDYDYTGQMYSNTVMVQGIVLWNAAEIAEHEEQVAKQAEQQRAVEVEREALLDRRAEIIGRLGLTQEEAAVLFTNAP